MKFSCGKTRDWINQQTEFKIKELRKPKRWFAWHPVAVGSDGAGNSKCVWLEWVYRRFPDAIVHPWHVDRVYKDDPVYEEILSAQD